MGSRGINYGPIVNVVSIFMATRLRFVFGQDALLSFFTSDNCEGLSHVVESPRFFSNGNISFLASPVFVVVRLLVFFTHSLLLTEFIIFLVINIKKRWS